jgi:predicted DsbA family dithiol-disulfide isomerase
MTIDVYADIACPWCYVGRARLKKALAQRSDRDDSSSREEAVSGLHPDLDVTLRWRPFQLQPDMPADGQDFREVLERKFGSWSRAERMFERIEEMGGEDGLTFNFDAIEVAPNTADAHRLVLWAEEQEGQKAGDEMATTLFHAYFTEGRNVSDRDVLVECAVEAGLNADDARALLDGNEYVDAVHESQRQAEKRGVTGVPCYVFNDKQAVTGAQPAEVFVDVLDTLAPGAPTET